MFHVARCMLHVASSMHRAGCMLSAQVFVASAALNAARCNEHVAVWPRVCCRLQVSIWSCVACFIGMLRAVCSFVCCMFTVHVFSCMLHWNVACCLLCCVLHCACVSCMLRLHVVCCTLRVACCESVACSTLHIAGFRSMCCMPHVVCRIMSVACCIESVALCSSSIPNQRTVSLSTTSRWRPTTKIRAVPLPPS